MNFEVNGIAFSKEELSTIALSDLKVSTISHAHLFYIPAKSKNAFMILRAGDYIDQTFIDKYTAKGLSSFHALEISSLEEISNYKKMFATLKSAYNEKERQIVAQRIAKKFGEDYWKESKGSYLSFVLTCFDSFYNLPESVVEKYQNTSLTLYSRAMISSSLSIMTCFVHKIVDPKFIQDLYNVIFALDFGLLEGDNFTYSLASACEAERNNPGSGKGFLQQSKRSSEEIQRFVQHPILSAKFIEKNKDIFEYPEVYEVVQYHHEKGDGSGFPSGVSYSGIGDFETFQMFCDNLVPFSEHIYKRGDGQILIKEELLKVKANISELHVPIKKVLLKWEACMNWAIHVDEVIVEEKVAS